MLIFVFNVLLFKDIGICNNEDDGWMISLFVCVNNLLFKIFLDLMLFVYILWLLIILVYNVFDLLKFFVLICLRL